MVNPWSVASRPGVYQQALTVAGTVNHPDEARGRLLAALAPRLTPQLLPDALVAADGVDNSYGYGRAFAGLAPHLPLELLADMRSVAATIQRAGRRALALLGLAPYLPSAQRAQALIDALAAARAIEPLGPRAQLRTRARHPGAARTTRPSARRRPRCDPRAR